MRKNLFSKLLCIMVMLIGLPAMLSAEEYVTLSNGRKTLTFYNDSQRTEHDKEIVNSDGTKNNTLSTSSDDAGMRKWHQYADKITEVVFDESFINNTVLTDCSTWFLDCKNLKNVDLSMLNSDNLENVESMFEGCTSLETITLGNFDITNAAVKDYIFADTKDNFKIITSNAIANKFGVPNNGIYSWNEGNFTIETKSIVYYATITSSGTLTFNSAETLPSGAFALNSGNEDPSWLTNSAKIRSVDFSGLNGYCPTTLANWFKGCTLLTTVDFTKLDLTKVTSINSLFSGCTSLTEVIWGAYSPTSSVDTENAFDGINATIYYIGNDASILALEDDQYHNIYGGNVKIKGFLTSGEKTYYIGSGSESLSNNYDQAHPYTFKFTVASDLSSITIKSQTTEFKGDLVLPEQIGGIPVTTITSPLYEDNSYLTSVTIPSTVNSITQDPDSYLTIDCKNLKEIKVEEGNSSFTSIDGVLYDKEVKTLLSYPNRKRQTTVPATVESFGRYAFAFAGFTLNGNELWPVDITIQSTKRPTLIYDTKTGANLSFFRSNINVHTQSASNADLATIKTSQYSGMFTAPITLPASGYATFASPLLFSVGEGGQAFGLTDATINNKSTNPSIKAQSINGKIHASSGNNAVIIKGQPNSKVDITYYFNGSIGYNAQTYSEDTDSKNYTAKYLLASSDCEPMNLQQETDGAFNYVLSGGKFCLVKASQTASESKLPANKAYLSLPATSLAKGISIIWDDETTGISEVETISVTENNAVFNLQGIKVADSLNNNLPAGIYIVNGKKISIK